MCFPASPTLREATLRASTWTFVHNQAMKMLCDYLLKGARNAPLIWTSAPIFKLVPHGQYFVHNQG